MKTKMYVITHAQAGIPGIPSYVSLLVGAGNGKAKGEFDERDDAGENISGKNSSYCELTGIYWIWKNSSADNVGVCHYRRFFSKNALSGLPKHFVTGPEIERLLARKRIVLPKPRCYGKTMLAAVNYAPNRTDVKEMHEAVRMCAPEYLEDFKWYFRQDKSYLFNMCIMKKNDFDAYCTWLFPILSRVEEMHDMAAETDPYRRRLFGFLSERLLCVWVHRNVAPSDIVELPVVNTAESDWTRFRHWVGNAERHATFLLAKLRRKTAENQKSLEAAVFG